MATKKTVYEAPAPASDKKKALQTALSQIDKNFGKGTVMRLGDRPEMNVEAIPTGSLALDAALGLPESDAEKISGAASLMHMMNANTFTAGAYHVSDAANQQTVVDSLKDNIMNRQWMCGFPDTLIVASVGGEYVVSAFGNAEVIEKFKTNLQAQYDVTKIVYEESLVQ